MAQEEVTLERSLDNAANVLRSKMDANEYKNYTLGTIFYKYLSDSMLYYVAELLEEKNISLEEAQKLYEENQDDQYLIEELDIKFNYVIEAKNTYTNILKSINNHTFQVSQLGDAFNSIESQGKEFEGLFDDYDLYSKRLGNTAQKQSDTISEVLSAIGKLEIVKTPEDTLGNAYEYLIKQFASESGKKAGEFYTPQKVSRLLARLTLVDKDYTDGMTVYDPTMGSGSLLLNFRKYVEHSERITYFGQEINTSTYNLARMNMILHHVDVVNQKLRNNDTLDEDWPVEEITNFDAVVMNPPYSHKWSANAGFKDDPRFSAYGVLPPKSKADYAFLLHERKCEELALIKKALLQKLFPKKDEFKPEVRYKNFSDAWEQRKLGEVATFINGRAYKQNELLDSGKYKVLRVGNFYTNDSWYYSNLELADKYYIDKGDLVYTWSATFGPHIWDGEKVIYHYHIWKIELSESLDRDFTLQILEADKAKLLANTNGSTMIHVTKKDMESKVISLPNIEEQKQIGSYLMKFDSLIALHQRKLEKLKQLKKFLLQNMFI
ncbi:N-6 DNA methylase [Ligilactobacillus salivarius]|uniref:N-6 DNA methylase n=13 Tax=Ligilactobacillus salivarius TaxID=1624 RepID=UPI0024816F90|nr:N-6 DNA methylase [Ligilactobacillus salivarius]WGT59406.1 N-6 DNA methylase [Ligilactobacillus salivarius]